MSPKDIEQTIITRIMGTPEILADCRGLTAQQVRGRVSYYLSLTIFEFSDNVHLQFAGLLVEDLLPDLSQVNWDAVVTALGGGEQL